MRSTGTVMFLLCQLTGGRGRGTRRGYQWLPPPSPPPIPPYPPPGPGQGSLDPLPPCLPGQDKEGYPPPTLPDPCFVLQPLPCPLPQPGPGQITPTPTLTPSWPGPGQGTPFPTPSPGRSCDGQDTARAVRLLHFYAGGLSCLILALTVRALGGTFLYKCDYNN